MNTSQPNQAPTENIALTNRLFLRPDEVCAAVGISRRTLSDWQQRRLIPFRRVGRTCLFAAGDIQRALDRFLVRATSDIPRRHRTPARDEPRPPKRRMGRVTDQQGAPTAANPTQA